jgi:hypothetical protein
MTALKGWRTYAIGFAMAVVPAGLTYLAGLDWTKIVSPQLAPIIAGVIMIAMRSITTTSPGSNS